MIYKAKHRYADVTARKMRPFAQHVRGKNVDDALEQLRFYPNRGARLLEQVIKSALGNAQDQGCRNVDDLVLTECRIDDGPMYKRIRPRARGTAFMILKRLAHIVVTLTDVEALEEATLKMQESQVAAAPQSSTSSEASASPASSSPAQADATKPSAE